MSGKEDKAFWYSIRSALLKQQKYTSMKESGCSHSQFWTVRSAIFAALSMGYPYAPVEMEGNATV